MAIRSGMFNSVNGDRKVDAAFFSLFFSTFIGDGVFPNPSTGLQIVEGQGMQTIVKPGKGWIQGRFVINDSDHIFKHDIADGVLKRIDRVVMRLNHLTRQIEIVLKKGSQASSPTAPTIQRDAEAYELVLADVLINAGTTQITQGNITDQRLNKSLCGIVHGFIDQVDTTTIFNQYQSWFNQYSTGKALEFQEWQTRVTSELEAWIQAEELDFTAWKQDQELTFIQWSDGRKDAFDVWFATIRGILDEEAAGNIMNVINDHKDSPVPHKYYDEGLAQPMLYGLKRNADLNTPAFVYGATEAGPLSTINLPSYEQVEGVKTALKVEMENTGGKIVDIYNKKYKAVMSELGEFKDHFGVDEGAKLDDDFKAKYPTMAAKYKLMGGYVRTHLWNNIHFIQIGLDVIFVDMKNLTVISAHTVSHINYVYSVNTPTNYFVDSKYIYIRGRPNTNNSLSFAVFDKNTFQFVTAIRLATAISGFTDQVIVGEMVLQGNRLFATCASFNNQIFCFNLSYDGNGVPTGLTSGNVGSFGSGSGNPPKIFYGDSEFLYVGYITGGLTIEKRKYNSVTFLYDLIASNTSPTNGFSTNPTWIYKYKVDGVNYMLVHGTSNSTINVLNMDTMSLHNQIFSGQSDQYPTFDYDKGDKLYIQPQSAVFVDINGLVFEQYCELTLVGNLWYPKWNFTPVLKRYNSDASIAISRIFMLGSRGFVKDGVLCAYRSSPIPGGLTGHFKYDNMSVLSHYKEVIE
ncbi:hypothetical protein ACIP9C_22755 [Lysinibacillus sp. NPDC093210]|uniref:hypothetical protein n=1 Tax=Lysinibacillus sp. NPDC093210 TaxID=3364133 RepID=UPI0037F58DC2